MGVGREGDGRRYNVWVVRECRHGSGNHLAPPDVRATDL